MKRVLTIIIPALALCACASDPARTAAAEKPGSEKHCIRDTGSRIPNEGECSGNAGRSYSREELERSGEMTTGGALNRVDPTVGR